MIFILKNLYFVTICFILSNSGILYSQSKIKKKTKWVPSVQVKINGAVAINEDFEFAQYEAAYETFSEENKFNSYRRRLQNIASFSTGTGLNDEAIDTSEEFYHFFNELNLIINQENLRDPNTSMIDILNFMGKMSESWLYG